MTLTTLPIAISGHASVAVDSCTFISLGGCDEKRIVSRSVQSFNVRKNAFTKLSPMKAPRLQPAATFLNGRIYACGGNRSDALKSVERFSLKTRKWKKIKSMNEVRWAPASASHNTSIYIFGGYGRGRYISSAERYNELEGKWRMLPEMDQPRFQSAAVTLEHKIYVIGGRSRQALDSVICFNTITQSWDDTLITMPVALYGLTAVVYNKYIIVIGGKGKGRESNDKYFILDTESNQWTRSPESLTTPRRHHTTVMMQGMNIISTGGHHHTELNSMENTLALDILPPQVRQLELQTLDELGRLPIHIAADNGIVWVEGMKEMVESCPKSLAVPNKQGDLPITLLLKTEPDKKNDLTSIYEMVKVCLGLNLLAL
jgi:N-acetylneuraminic acid mutarotase